MRGGRERNYSGKKKVVDVDLSVSTSCKQAPNREHIYRTAIQREPGH